MSTEVKLTAETPEYSQDFLQGMLNRMDMSFFKYGRFGANYKGEYDREFLAALKKTLRKFLNDWDGKTWMRDGQPVRTTTAGGNAILFILRRLDAYLTGRGDAPGNTEYLIDAANGLMIEFVCPQVPKAYFKATDVKGSTGFAGISEREMEKIRNG